MHYAANALALAWVLHTACALRPENVTICDYYTPLVTNQTNSAASQRELMLKITHTFILGNYTTPNFLAVPGIAAPGVSPMGGPEVNMLNYFTGAYASTNLGGDHGEVKVFLDDGGPAPLLAGQPALGTKSNQYNLLTHVYQYFGSFYGCSYQNNSEFPAYQGRASMFEVHRFMDLDKYETSFFAQQITLAVASFGFEQPDIDYTNTSLATAFGHRCSSPAAVIPPDAGPQLQSICVAADCPLDDNPICDAYPNNGIVAQPDIVNATLAGNVTKINETEAILTASWPSHCETIAARDVSGGSTVVCTASPTGSSGGAAASASSSAAGRDVKKDSSLLLWAAGWVLVSVGAGAITFGAI